MSTHVMFSYAWGVKQEMVRSLAENLKKNGVDVWIDTQGSSILRKMEDSTDEKMSQASSILFFF